MKPSSVYLRPLHKRILYAVFALLWLTGAAWLYCHFFGQRQGPYGIEKNPAQPILLEIHGAAAMLFLVLFGTILMDHVPVGWKRKAQRPSGISLIAAVGIMAMTGWGLYYMSGESSRWWITRIHWILGLALPLLIVLHIQGRRD